MWGTLGEEENYASDEFIINNFHHLFHLSFLSFR